MVVRYPNMGYVKPTLQEAAVAILMQGAPGMPDRLRDTPDLHAIISGYVPPERLLLGDPTIKALKLLVKRQGIGPERLKKQVTPEFVDRSMRFLINFLYHGKGDDILLPPLRHLGKFVSSPGAYDRARLSLDHGRAIWHAVKAILKELTQSADSDDSDSDETDYD